MKIVMTLLTGKDFETASSNNRNCVNRSHKTCAQVCQKYRNSIFGS